ncbi:MAG: MGMT family protein [Desulfovibrionaceae bacterium]|nr:MGMT family protein [Desulfovibrionaceae bacterium]
MTPDDVSRQTEALPFFSRVHALVASIPPGKVMTYGQIAEALDNVCSARYVGYAMHAAPEDMNLPCHRVINRLGEMAPGTIFGGAAEQARRLRAEGVVFKPNGRVDLVVSRYQPD